MRIFAYITTTSEQFNSTDDLQEHHENFPGVSNNKVFVYTYDTGNTFLTEEEILLIGRGLFFQNDWSSDDTITYVISEE